MSADHSVQSAAPDELAVRLARLGLPARGVQDRQAAPTSGEPITVTIDAEGWHWQPTTEAARRIFGGLLHQEPATAQLDPLPPSNDDRQSDTTR